MVRTNGETERKLTVAEEAVATAAARHGVAQQELADARAVLVLLESEVAQAPQLACAKNKLEERTRALLSALESERVLLETPSCLEPVLREMAALHSLLQSAPIKDDGMDEAAVDAETPVVARAVAPADTLGYRRARAGSEPPGHRRRAGSRSPRR